jgi:hypothetical protein
MKLDNVEYIVYDESNRDKKINGSYVYIMMNPTKSYFHEQIHFEPFYVGKGHNWRWKEKKNTRVEYERLQLERSNINVIYAIIHVKDNDEALTLEENLIEYFGRKVKNNGPLLNVLPGGHDPCQYVDYKKSSKRGGSKGRIISEESKEKNRQSNIRYFASEPKEVRVERFRKAGISNRKPKPSGFGEKVSKATSGIKKSKSHCASIGKASRGTKFINNGIINTKVKEENLEKYLSSGWSLGMKKASQ